MTHCLPQAWQVRELDALNFSWGRDPARYQWHSYFQLLRRFRQTNGHVMVPRGSDQPQVSRGVRVCLERCRASTDIGATWGLSPPYGLYDPIGDWGLELLGLLQCCGSIAIN